MRRSERLNPPTCAEGKEMQNLSRCVYCRNDFPHASLTRDHVIAGSWYPRSTPPTVQRISALSCRPCNTDRYSASERYLFLRFAACADPKRPAADGIWARAKRTMDIARARDDKERAHRQGAREAFGRGAFEMENIPDSGVLPSFVQNFNLGSRTAMVIQADTLHSVVEKWGLGVHSHIWKEAASVDAEVAVLHVGESVTRELFRGSEEHWNSLDCGPGIQIRYLAVREGDERHSLYEFRIWETFVTHVSIRETLK
jgi:hypothetical protein